MPYLCSLVTGSVLITLGRVSVPAAQCVVSVRRLPTAISSAVSEQEQSPIPVPPRFSFVGCKGRALTSALTASILTRRAKRNWSACTQAHAFGSSACQGAAGFGCEPARRLGRRLAPRCRRTRVQVPLRVPSHAPAPAILVRTWSGRE